MALKCFESVFRSALPGGRRISRRFEREVDMTQSKLIVIRLGDARRLTRGSPGENAELDGRPQP